MRSPLILSFLISLFSLGVVLGADDPTGVAAGQDVYTNYCASCHQPTGVGAPNMFPSLKGNSVVTGDANTLIMILLKGPAAVLPANRPTFPNSTMDSFYYKLSDEQIAAVLTYIRHDFGNGAAAVDLKTVKAARAKVDAAGGPN